MPITVSAKWVHEKMEDSPKSIVLFDTRFQLNDDTYGSEAFKKEHIRGAQYLDLNKDLSGKVQTHGGGHPLPEPADFAKKVGDGGVGSDTTVIVYDEGNGMFAARAWWVFYYMGHDGVYVLENGLAGWKKAGYDVTADLMKPTPRIFTPHVRGEEIVHMEEVREKIPAGEAVLIDSRAFERYLGNVEPMYGKAGHIPGAKNYFWQDVLKDDGSWKGKEELQDHFCALDRNEEIIVSCGSGVSACPNIIGLKKAGFTNVKLYPGSFSDWISYKENAVETKEE